MADAIALIDDLFFLAKVHETAKHTGVTLETAANGEQLLKAAAGEPGSAHPGGLEREARGARCHRAALCGERARQPAARDRVSIPCADGFGGTGARRGMPGRDAAVQVHAKSRGNIARSEIVKSRVNVSRTGFSLSGFDFAAARQKTRQAEARPTGASLAIIALFPGSIARAAQQQATRKP